MSAVEALREARAAGVGIVLDGADLLLRSSEPPPAAVIEALSRYKADIVALLQTAGLNEQLQGAAWHTSGTTALAEAARVSWAEWKAAMLNRLFQEQGIIGQPGRITSPTIRHGEGGRNRVDSVIPIEPSMSPAEAWE